MNGGRCRLVDVLEVLSDSGLGKEMHSVVSQGKVEQIVLSRPRERRMMIEEAAGLGKHRKRRRRAHLKLERTEANLARALDVEREARSRLRPLKQQAEAAELHERIERQSLEARLTLSAEAARLSRAVLAESEQCARAARAERDQAEELLAAVAVRREAAEAAFASHSRERERLQTRQFEAGAAAERIQLRLERVAEQAAAAQERRSRRLRQLEVAEPEEGEPDEPRGLPDGALPRPPGEGADTEPAAWEALPSVDRVRAIELELERLDAGREQRLEREVAGLEAEAAEARARATQLEASLSELREGLERAERAADEARSARREAERASESARARAAESGAELASLNRLVRAATAAPDGERALVEGLAAETGHQAALAAALGARLTAAVVEDLSAGERVLDGAADQGATTLVSSRAHGRPAGQAPAPRATRLLAHIRADTSVARLADRLLADVWVVDSLDSVSASFRGVAVTRSGRLLDGSTGELSQAAAGGGERLLEDLGRREALVAASERAAAEEQAARALAAEATKRVAELDLAREEVEAAVRRSGREVAEATDVAERAEWLGRRRREAPGEGPETLRRAELAADLRAERRMAERIERERGERARSLAALRTGAQRDAELVMAATRVASALELAGEAVGARRDALRDDVAQGAAVGDDTAAALRACAHEEAELQARWRSGSEAVTAAEVSAQQTRDAAAEVERELGEVAGRLGFDPAPASEPLPDEDRVALEARVERLARRREQLGPVNPLAAQEYKDAVAHVEELEAQREDLEAALAELEDLIKETDRRIRESFEQTFAAAAANFEDVVQHLFPGGRGRLRLARADQTPRPVVGGEPVEGTESPEEDWGDDEPEMGVEIEVTPPGKSAKRLSLLSGGEKSLVALAFMFAVFLARPCPFYILDEVEAALDDINIDRFLELVRRYSDRAQFIVVTHQKRTMDAADTLYGVSMGGDGVSQVISRRLGGRAVEVAAA